MGEHLEDQHGPEHGEDPDGQRQPGGDDASEHGDEDDQGQGEAQRLGATEVLLGAELDLTEHLRLAGDADGDHRPRALQLRGAGGDGGVHSVLVAADPAEHQRTGAVAAAQPRRAEGPVRRRLGDPGTGSQLACERGARRRHRGRVDRPGAGGHQQHEVGLSGVEAVAEQLGGAAGVR